jgi:bifunctional DNA-binding transcriptional regulator/antitoxin component of YhaV-PrlF toxin-antitoxin module
MRIEAKQDEDAEDENVLRRLVLPAEDRRRYGTLVGRLSLVQIAECDSGCHELRPL